MLSLSRGTPIAKLSLNKKKDKIVYVTDVDEEEENDIDSGKRDEVLPKSFYTELRNITPANLNLLKRAIRYGDKSILKSSNQISLDAFDKAQIFLKELLRKNIEIPRSEGKIEVIPNPDSWTGHYAVFGPSGVGKSTWIGNFLSNYKKEYPKNKIYVFSPLRDDPAFKHLKVEYVKIDESIVEDPLDVQEFENSVLVFDDIESIKEKVLRDAVQNFRDQVMETGRHFNEVSISVSHIILNGPSTKRMLNECDRVVLFPKSNFNAISNLCRRYYGFGKDELNYMKSVPSRWVCIKRSYPTAIISEQAIKLL